MSPAPEPPPPGPTGEALLVELRRRSARLDAGELLFTPWEEVKRRVRERVEGTPAGRSTQRPHEG